MADSRIEGGLFVRGQLSAQSMSYPNGSIIGADVAGDAAIEASKLQHQYIKPYSQEMDTTAAADKRAVHVVKGTTATLQNFEAGLNTVITGDSTVTIDLLNGTSTVLSTPIVLTNADAALVVSTGNISTTAATDGDVLVVAVTVNAGTGSLGDGVFAALCLREDAT